MDNHRRILVVEDEPNMRELVVARLEQHGYEVAASGDGYDALAKVKKFNPELIVLDLMLPKLDGYTVCRMLRCSMSDRIPIILFTARSSPDDAYRGIEMGADAYVTKPFEPSVLLGKIDELLNPKKPDPAPASPPEAKT